MVCGSQAAGRAVSELCLCEATVHICVYIVCVCVGGGGYCGL